MRLSKKPLFAVLIPVVLAGALALAGCSRETSLPQGSASTPVIIISLDTVRSDRLPVYGYEQGSTPHLDAFRKDAILYERAYAHYPLTLPSHASLLTGRLPAETGIRDNVGFRLDGSVATVGERLRDSGYATGAAISAFVLRKEAGLDRGFDFYDDEVEAIGPSSVIGRVQRAGEETARVAQTWISGQQNRPFLFMLHLYEPHTPYEPPEPFRSRTANPYDGEIAHVDQIVGDFLAFLRSRGLYDRSLIIVLSDHGEGLNDHGEEEHGIFLYREAIQVPLLIKLPENRFGGRSVADPVQLIDIVPTVLQQTATPASDLQLPGTSLVDFLDGKKRDPRKIYSETYYPKFHFGWSDLHSLIDDQFHFIRAPRPELYRVDSDPSETKNLLEQERRVYFAMSSAIDPLVREAQAPSAVDPEEAAKLAALGYLGSTVSTEPGQKLPDPKDTIDVFRQIRTAFTLYRDERFQDALVLIDSLLKENARMLDLWDLRSKALARLGRSAEAIEAAQEGLRLAPHATHLAVSIANLSLETGDLDSAQAHAELAIKSEPGPAHEVLARVWISRGDLARAEQEARRALETSGDTVPALITLARVERDRGRLTEALAWLERAEERLAKRNNREVWNYHLIRGDVLARMGRAAEAESEFRKEIRLFPQERQAYKNLILLLVDQGKLVEIEKLVETAEDVAAYQALCEILQVLGDRRTARHWARRGLQKFPDDPGLSMQLRSL
ncbi:MAG TPA: sulfatase-like hydrolase/transferase [Thermoanaerobaculia bacterium]|nr:sulfatase-like hydrolase/transferase [Thermoanaerobaculia bacterium]